MCCSTLAALRKGEGGFGGMEGGSTDMHIPLLGYIGFEKLWYLNHGRIARQDIKKVKQY